MRNLGELTGSVYFLMFSIDYAGIGAMPAAKKLMSSFWINVMQHALHIQHFVLTLNWC